MSHGRPGRRQTRLLLALIAAFFLTLLWQKPLTAPEPVRQVATTAGNAARRIPIYSVAVDEPRIAISFDAAWGADHTTSLLDTLAAHNVKTTFFLVSFWIEAYPDLAREIIARGHEIGLHSATHPDLTALSAAEVRAELEHNRDLIIKTTGFTPTLFRPPFGAYNNQLLEIADDELGLTTIQWSVDSLDWRDDDPESVTARVVDRVRPGDIVLFHNNAAATARALPGILQRLQALGYEIVPISELIHPRPFRTDHTGRQHPVPQGPSDRHDEQDR